MKVLLDEDVPVPLIKVVQHILRGHTGARNRQHLVRITVAVRKKRYAISDPSKNPPSPYWR
jgi:hypothetical protein